jgi:F-type H+-transporting ATPase subunit delta
MMIAQSWSKALLELVVAAGELAQTRTQLTELAHQVSQSEDLRTVFSNPTITVGERKKVVQELAVGSGWSRTMKNFMLLLTDRRRLGAVGAIAASFEGLADKHEGIVRARVSVASELTDTQMSSLVEALAKLTGKRVEVETQLEPSLVGGMRVNVDGKVYDTTVRAQLDGLRQSILKELQ